MIDDFIAPERLWGLLVVIVFAIGYVAVGRWRSRATIRFTQVSLLESLAPSRPGWRRHAVAAVNLAGLAAGVVALARPTTTSLERLSSDGRIVILFDVSSSMAATDVAPDRLSAAQAAAETFVAQVDDDVEIGLISFSGTVAVVAPPTLDRSLLEASIGGLTLAPSTAIGDALARGTELLTDLADSGSNDSTDGAGDASNATNATAQQAPGALVVLSDGETTVGLSTEQGAAAAAAAGVPVFTIAFGTADGTIVNPSNGQPQSVAVQPGPLRDVAAVTGGSAYEAATADELADAYAQIREVLGETLGAEVERTSEITWAVAAFSIGLLAAGWALSLWWLRGIV